jgi:hypothetical protein
MRPGIHGCAPSNEPARNIREEKPRRQILLLVQKLRPIIHTSHCLQIARNSRLPNPELGSFFVVNLNLSFNILDIDRSFSIGWVEINEHC